MAHEPRVIGWFFFFIIINLKNKNNMKYFSEKQVKELLGQQRAICQKDFEKGKNNVLFSDIPKLKNGVIGKVYSSDKIEEIKSEAWRKGFNCSDSMSFL